MKPEDPRLTTELSDLHVVASQAVRPTRAFDEESYLPTAAPCTVNDTDPSDATFICAWSETGDVYEAASVRLPTTTPAVTSNLSVLPIPIPHRHRTVVDDIQSVASHSVPPIEVFKVCEAEAKPDPASVIDMPPDTRFVGSRDKTAGASYERVFVIDPTPVPTVKPTFNVRETPAAERQTITLSDIHSVASHPVHDPRPLTLISITPNPDPETVTRELPTPTFVGRSHESAAPSYDIASVNDPACTPAVSPTRIVLPVPDPILHPTELADTHAVASHAVPPTLNPPL